MRRGNWKSGLKNKSSLIKSGRQDRIGGRQDYESYVLATTDRDYESNVAATSDWDYGFVFIKSTADFYHL